MSRGGAVRTLLATATVAALCLVAASSARVCSCVGPDPDAGYASFLESADGAVVPG